MLVLLALKTLIYLQNISMLLFLQLLLATLSPNLSSILYASFSITHHLLWVARTLNPFTIAVWEKNTCIINYLPILRYIQS
jgi:hypothetical protein